MQGGSLPLDSSFEGLPTVTVIIPAPPGNTEVLAATAARQLHYPAAALEVLTVRGKQPSAQRNLAIREARGELIYFLDDDSLPHREALQRGVRHFKDPLVQVVGGPNLCPAQAPLLEQVFFWTMSSWIAFGPSRARYAQVGAERLSSEKELILCNLMARRETLLRHGGFDEALYPNEENALMDDIEKEGGKLIYDPDLYVERRPRRTLKAFCKMLMTYGRGRAEQFRLHPGPGSALNLIPPLFCLFVLATPLAPSLTLPLWGLYLLLLILQTLLVGKGIRRVGVFPLLFLTHLLYGVGFWRGLFTHPKPQPRSTYEAIKLERG